ncbi:MAG: hypothetical protein Q9199_001106 [Rusavskia elegans]
MSVPRKAAADAASGPGPADADFSTQRRSQGADAPHRLPIREQAWPSIQSGREQTLDELIQEAQRPVFKNSIISPDARVEENPASLSAQLAEGTEQFYQRNADIGRKLGLEVDIIGSARPYGFAPVGPDGLPDPREALHIKPDSPSDEERPLTPAIKGESRKRSAAYLDSDESSGVIKEEPSTKKRSIAQFGLDEPSGAVSDDRYEDRLRDTHVIQVAPYLPVGARIPVLTPSEIRKARQEYVDQLASSHDVSLDVVANAFAIPSKICDNVGCDQLHLSEDCTLALMCSGCCQIGHVAHECGEVCSRCGQDGHVQGRCTATKKRRGRKIRDPPAQLMPVLRPPGLQGRTVPGLRERLLAEARVQASYL